ncbi:thioredoxin domain-containing protein [Actinophytocola sp.]|uniref:DsbA family protein n=1 Tax=Actinophytocola sp. TaxID=1872138 RepID=UPI0025C254AF|nr:thioredoxin domain-containing protein [Actinophytocola sp.]
MAAARAGRPGRTGIVLGLVIVLVLAVVVIGGALWVTAHKTAESSGPIPAVTSAPDGLAVSLDRDTATAVVGRASAVTMDVYEDFLCPACQQFEQSYGKQMAAKLTSGAIQVRYHLVNLLDDRSDPPGYSLRAANAALVAADVAPEKFLNFYRSLLTAQPKEGAQGYDTGQLVELGRRLGINDARFAEKIASGAYDRAIHDSLATAMADPALQRPAVGGMSFGTPTVAVNGTVVDIGAPDWLDQLTIDSQPVQ